MANTSGPGKINVKVLAIVVAVVVVLGAALLVARQIRRRVLSARDLAAGSAAYEKQDWADAARYFREYLGRHPEDVEILKKYGEANLSVTPIEAENVRAAITAYRCVLRLSSDDAVSYEKLAMLYMAVGNHSELAHVARKRLKVSEGDLDAPIWLGQALVALHKPDDARKRLTAYIEWLKPRNTRHPQYVDACAILSGIEAGSDLPGSGSTALGYLSQAVEYDPESPQALLQRALFYRTARSKLPDEYKRDDKWRKEAVADLKKADALSPTSPHIRLALCREWIVYRELDKAAAELDAVKDPSPALLKKHFFRKSDWVVARFEQEWELALLRGVTAEDVKATDRALRELEAPRQRVHVLCGAVRVFLAGGEIDKARKALDEYTEIAKGMDSKPEPPWRVALLKAEVARAQSRLYRVIDELEPVVVADSSRPSAWKLLAEAYSRTDQTRRAVQALIRYLRLRPRDPEATLQLAREYLKLRDWNRAYETARLAESLDPADIVIRLLRIEASIYVAAEGRARIVRQELAKLVEELAISRRKHKDRVDIRILQAIIAMQQGRPAVAEKELKDAVAQCKEPLRARMQLVRHYHRTKRPAEAMAACREACERHPDLAEPWLSLSGLHVSAGKYDEALASLRKGLDTVRGRWEKRALSIRLGLVELLHGDRPVGIEVLKNLAGSDPHEVRARSVLLDLQEVRQDPAWTSKLIGEVRAAQGESGLLWRLYQASVWLRSPDWRARQQDVTDMLQRCIDSDPEWSAPALLMATMHRRLGNLSRAEEICRQALSRNPSATDVANRLVSLLEEQGRFADAQGVLKRVETDPQMASLWNVRLALKSGDFTGAIDELKLRAANDDRDAESRILLAKLTYWQTRDAARAFVILDQAEKIAPRSMVLTEAKVAIHRAEGQDKQARELLDRCVNDHKSFTAHLMRGSHLAATGKAELAEKDFLELTKFPDKAARGYEVLSKFYAETGRLDDAVATLDKAARAYPDDLSVKQNLMKALTLRKAPGKKEDPSDVERAENILAELEGRLPSNPELMRVRAIRLLRKGTPEANRKARGLLEQAVRVEPTLVKAHLALIGSAMQRRNFAEARDHATRALGPNPDHPVLMLARARAEMLLNNAPMAAELTRLVLRRYPGSRDARGVFVDIAASAGDANLLDEALEMATKAIADNPADEAPRLWQAHLLNMTKQSDKAIEGLEAFCQSKEGSRSFDAFLALGELYRVRGETDTCRRMIDKAAELKPDSPALVLARLRLLGTLGRFGEVAALAHQHHKSPTGNIGVIMTAAAILVTSNNVEDCKQAVTIYERVTEAEPWSIDAKLGLAAAAVMTGQVDRAEKTYRQLLEDNPDNPQALNDLAWLLTRYRKLHTSALSLAERGLAIAPTNRHLLDTRGEILSHLPGRLDDAKRDFEKVLAMVPEGSKEQAKALLQLGRAHVKLGDLPEAQRCFRKAQVIDQRLSVFTDKERKEISGIINSTPKS